VILRKSEKKSNIEIGIFKGKRAKYNLAILEALLEHPSTSWQIAKAIEKRFYTSKSRELVHYRAQKIYSAIQRKGGRLAELAGKGYIEKAGKVWAITAKGFVALMLANPKLVAERVNSLRDLLVEALRRISVSVKQPFGIKIELKPLMRGLERATGLFEDPAFLSAFAEEAKALVEEGVDLDRVDWVMFALAVLSRERMVKMWSEALGEVARNG